MSNFFPFLLLWCPCIWHVNNNKRSQIFGIHDPAWVRDKEKKRPGRKYLVKEKFFFDFFDVVVETRDVTHSSVYKRKKATPRFLSVGKCLSGTHWTVTETWSSIDNGHQTRGNCVYRERFFERRVPPVVISRLFNLHLFHQFS